MLTGKTIGQLTYLDIPTPNTMIPVELSGGTYHIDFSAITGNVGGVIETTYSGLVGNITGATLTTGAYYIISDFRTCYDQPNFDSLGSAIIVGNYKQSNIEPIIVFATSANTISTTAYQPAYPNDRIQYDWTFSGTEITSGVAYGRISERIDQFNNRTDYDHRTILFKRYQYIELDMDNPLQGTVTITPTSSTEMNVVGTNTLFSGLSVGQYVGFKETDFRAYEITTITGNTAMTISGLTNYSVSNVEMYIGNSLFNTIYYQNNITTAYTEYHTFDYESTNLNNYIGNFANLFNYDGNSFILANNVFLPSTYRNNTFGDSCYNNSFDDDCENNIIGNYFYNNSTDDDFDGNTIGNYFHDNRITANFQYNRIGENFENNYIVQNDFYRNNIMNYYNNNIISGNDFQNNEIGNQYGYNTLRNGQFYKNDIGNDYNANKVYSNFFGNLIGNGYNNNDIYSQFYENIIGEGYANNNIGNINTPDTYYFYSNKIGNDFYDNTVGNTFYYNNIQNNFYNNNISDGFQYNQIGSLFNNNTIGNNFGFGYSYPQGNKIGNNFYNNNVGEYFYNNSISDNFRENTIDNFFQWNIVNTTISGVCLSTGMLYDITTVNVFKNKNGDDRLSYYDEVDVLTIETLTEAPCLGELNALDIPENDLNFGLVINLVSFTITSSDFTFGGDIDTDTTPLGVDGVDGFENTASQNSLYDGYYGTGLSGTSLSGLTTAYNNLGLGLSDNIGRLWYVTWGSGSSINQGIVKFGGNVNGVFFDIQTIDTTDPAYLENDNGNGTSLVGTFLFPATFTIYQPITNKYGWC